MNDATDIKRWLLWSAALTACALLLFVLWPATASSDEERRAVREGRTVILYWDRHSGHEHAARRALIDEFNRSQNEVYVRAVPIGFNALTEKALTSIAGGAPPDIMSLDGSIICQLAGNGLFLPLDDFVAGEPEMTPDRFFPCIWPMIHFAGHVWTMPTTTDVICLVWNKKEFAKAGLDPERPPQTLEELEQFASKLTIRKPNGSIEQMGFLPWLPWDNSYMWGVLFGGQWYNDKTGLVKCAGDPAIVRSFEWQLSFTRGPDPARDKPFAMDPDMVTSFSKGLGEYMSANNPFYAGRVAMMTEGEWQVAYIPKYAPGLDWGVAPIPQPAGAAPAAYDPTILGDVIPATARHPEAAKKFLHWFYNNRPDGDPSPVSDYNAAIRNIPPRIDDAMQDRFMGHPKFSVFVRQLLDRPVEILPIIPINRLLTDEIERQRERVVMRKVTPEQAAREIQDTTNRELIRLRSLAKGEAGK
jgi:multiple sugar transport system substrate-binding protein